MVESFVTLAIIFPSLHSIYYLVCDRRGFINSQLIPLMILTDRGKFGIIIAINHSRKPPSV